jgi:UDP-glucose 4-epimerase
MRAEAQQAGAERREGALREGGRVVAVTGACSFLGRNLIAILEADPSVARVVALDVTRPETAGDKTSFVELDLTAPSAERVLAEQLAELRVRTLVHLAFLGAPTHAEGFAHELEALGTIRLFRAARRALADPARARLVLVSHTWLYGAHRWNPNFLDEDHPLRCDTRERWLADRVEAERAARELAGRVPSLDLAVLRMAPLLGPTVQSPVSRWLAHRLVPTLLGFDPLVQLLHEVDALAALRRAEGTSVRGTFNVVSRGVLPLSKVVRLAGRTAVPLLGPALRAAAAGLWAAGASSLPPTLTPYLRYLCVADGARAEAELGFRPAFSTKEAVLDWARAAQLREAKLLPDVASDARSEDA